MSDNFTHPIGGEQETNFDSLYEGLSPEERRERIYLEPAFRDAYNEILRAHQVVQVPKYFWDHWVPVLGPVAAAAYMKLRQHCFYNPQTGERRDWCWPKQETLAQEIGIRDRESLRASLVALEVHGFIKREAQYVVDRFSKRPRRASDKYFVFFEIPLIDRDAVGLLIRRATSRNGAQDRPSPYAAEKPPHRPEVVENRPYEAGKPPQEAGGKTASKNKYLEPVLEERNVAAPTRNHAEPIAVTLRRRFPKKSHRPKKHLSDILPEISVSREKRDELLRVEDLAAQIHEQLGDSHSKAFHRSVARGFAAAGLQQLVYQTLSEVKEGARDGRLHNPAAVFTARIKQLAAAHGIQL